MAFLPVGLMRSPMTRTRSMGTVRVPLHTAAGTQRGTSRMALPSSARAIRAMYSGVVPQQPPYSLTPRSARAAMLRARKADADIIIALPHWGPEYVTEPSDVQREWADSLLAWGADAVIGTHPHVVQNVEFPVVYSLGNFVSNMSRHDTELGLAYRLDIAVTVSGLAFLAGGEAIPLWCSRPGGYGKEYTVLPVKEFVGRRDEFLGGWNYDRMIDTYTRLRPLFEQQK